MKNKLSHRILALVMAGMMCFSVLPTAAFAEEQTEVPQPAPVVEIMESEGGEAAPSHEEHQEQQEQDEDADPDPLPVEQEIVEPEIVEIPAPVEPEAETAAEKCVAYEHLSDPNGICTVCGVNLADEFAALYNRVDEDEYLRAMNRWGWLEQHSDPEHPEEAEQAENEAMSLVALVCDAVDVFSCLEAEGLASGDMESMILHLFQVDELARQLYAYPQNSDTFGKGEVVVEDMDELLYAGLPDEPTGSYMGRRGLPVATGNTKVSISGWKADLFRDNGGYFDTDALNAGDNTVRVVREPGKDYAIVPIMVQVEYPANGSCSFVTVPDGVEVLSYSADKIASQKEKDSILYSSYEETSASLSSLFVRAKDRTTVSVTYVDPEGNRTEKQLTIMVGDTADADLQRLGGAASNASVYVDRPTPSVTTGKITRTEYVGDTWLIWFNGEPAYCCNHGLNGRVNGCPTYSYSATSVISADQYTGDHYSTQVGIWGGLGQLSLGAAEVQHEGSFAESAFAGAASVYGLEEQALLEYCYRIYDDKQMYVITRYPDSEAAKIYLESARAALSGAEVLASNTGYYTYIYSPPIGGWQNVAVIGPACDEPGEDVTPEYYASWTAPPQTASGSFESSYGVTTDKVQLETTEKVDGATIEIEPVQKSGEIDGGRWNITPADKQTVTTSGHTSDESYHLNGGAASASWQLKYEVTKTSGSKNGQVGPYSSQEEADSAADSARDSAIAELKAEAQRMVDTAIATAKQQLAALPFRYDETVVPYGFLAYWGSNGVKQTISVPADTNNAYPMKNDEWSLQINIRKTDSETGKQIKGDAVYEIFEWDEVTGRYIPTGGYNQYSVQRQDDGTYAVINGSDYATSDRMKHTLYYTQRNKGCFIMVERVAPKGYFGDWTDMNNPGPADTVLGKRAYFVEITAANDKSVLWLENKDYSADIAKQYAGGTKLLTPDGVETTVYIYKESAAPAAAIQYKDAALTYDTDNSRKGANEDSFTVEFADDEMPNTRTLGEISISKVDLDAMRYLDGSAAAGDALASGQRHGNAALDGAIYDLYAAEDITHPDGVTGVVDYSKITNAAGEPIWHTTIRDNSGMWVEDYLPILRKDALVATAEIKDGWLSFSNLYLGKYYVVERSTGVTIPLDNGYYKLSGTYPTYDTRSKAVTGNVVALAKNSDGEYTDWVYKGQFSTVNEGKALDGVKTYDAAYISYAKGYLADEHNYYLTPSYTNEACYVEKLTFADNRQQRGEQLDRTSYSANYHISADNNKNESTDQVMKGNVELSKVVSSTGESNGVPLENAGFTFYLVSDLSKVSEFTQDRMGRYMLNSILSAYINPAYDNENLKYDFSGETQAIAKCYEASEAEIMAYNRTLTASGDYANGKGVGWVSTGKPQEYQLAEIYSNDTGSIRVQGLPYGTYVVVETSVPSDLYQAEPFLVVVDAQMVGNPMSKMCSPKDGVIEPSGSYQKYVILDEEIEVYLRLTKVDAETGKPVLRPGTAFQIYWIDENGNYKVDGKGNPRLVTMTNTHDGLLSKNVDTFYTDEQGVLTLPEKLPLGWYRAVEITGPEGFYNEWADTAEYLNGVLDESKTGSYYLDFEITTDRAYKATGDDSEDGQDILVIDESYINSETLGSLTIRKYGEVLTGNTHEDDGIDPEFSGMAQPGHFTYETRPIPGAEYTITALEDVVTQDNQKDGSGNRTLWYAKGDVVAKVTTGDGTAAQVAYAPGRTAATYDFLSIIHSGAKGEVTVTLPLGKYHVEETKPPYGFTGTSQSYDVSFVWDNQLNDVVMACSIADSENGKRTFDVIRTKDATETQQENQILAFTNEREKAKVGVYKVDEKTGEYVAGAVFNLYATDDVYSADGKRIFEAGDLIATSPETVSTGYTYFDVDIPVRGEYYGQTGMYIPTESGKSDKLNSGKYLIQEIKAPAGYYLNGTPMEVEFLYSGEALQVLDSTCKNQPTEVVISKQDLTNGAELPGATLNITDVEGQVVEEWVSGEEPTIIYGLHLGKEYSLTEVQPAIGYAFAESIRFRLIQKTTEDGKLLNEADVYIYTGKQFIFFDKWEKLDEAMVVMKDDTIKVSISKADIVSGEELPGAEIIIRDADGNKVDRWISTEEPHFIERMPAGDYTLEEITAPDGYAVSEKVPFTVLPTGEIQSVTMKDAPYFNIDKVKVGGELLPGAKLSVLDRDGNVVDSWITDSNSHKVLVTGLKDTLTGAVILSDKQHERVYTLHEDAAPAGYDLASNIQFKVEQDEANILAVYVRSNSKDEWVYVDGKTITMVDKLKPTPTPTPTPEPNPEPTPVPTPVPTPTPVVTTVPQTGDTANLWVWVLALIFSLMGLLIISIYTHCRKKKYTALVEVVEELDDEAEQ